MANIDAQPVLCVADQSALLRSIVDRFPCENELQEMIRDMREFIQAATETEDEECLQMAKAEMKAFFEARPQVVFLVLEEEMKRLQMLNVWKEKWDQFLQLRVSQKKVLVDQFREALGTVPDQVLLEAPYFLMMKRRFDSLRGEARNVREEALCARLEECWIMRFTEAVLGVTNERQILEMMIALLHIPEEYLSELKKIFKKDKKRLSALIRKNPWVLERFYRVVHYDSFHELEKLVRLVSAYVSDEQNTFSTAALKEELERLFSNNARVAGPDGAKEYLKGAFQEEFRQALREQFQRRTRIGVVRLLTQALQKMKSVRPLVDTRFKDVCHREALKGSNIGLRIEYALPLIFQADPSLQVEMAKRCSLRSKEGHKAVSIELLPSEVRDDLFSKMDFFINVHFLNDEEQEYAAQLKVTSLSEYLKEEEKMLVTKEKTAWEDRLWGLKSDATLVPVKLFQLPVTVTMLFDQYFLHHNRAQMARDPSFVGRLRDHKDYPVFTSHLLDAVEQFFLRINDATV